VFLTSIENRASPDSPQPSRYPPEKRPRCQCRVNPTCTSPAPAGHKVRSEDQPSRAAAIVFSNLFYESQLTSRAAIKLLLEHHPTTCMLEMCSPRLCVVLRLTHRHESPTNGKNRASADLPAKDFHYCFLYSRPVGSAAENRHVFQTMVIKIPKWTLGISGDAHLAPSEMASRTVCSPALPYNPGAWRPGHRFVPLSLWFVPGGEFLQLENKPRF
jgi:hypothetical protein